MARILFRQDLCDNSEDCWFLKDGNCPVHAIIRDDSTNCVKLNDDATCTGCMACNNHCPVAIVVDSDDYSGELKSLNERRPAVFGHISIDRFGTEPKQVSTKVFSDDFDFKACISNIENCMAVQLVELFGSSNVICKIDGIPFQLFSDRLIPVLRDYFGDAQVMHKIFYTRHDDISLNNFIEYFEKKRIGEHIKSPLCNYQMAPLLIVYYQGCVRAVLAHGQIKRNDPYEIFIDEMCKDLRNQLIKNVQGTNT